jgi:putative tributyrin esterase
VRLGEILVMAGILMGLSARREDTYVAGLSMGGYRALKWALRRPERFTTAASLSGALDVATRSQIARVDEPAMFRRVFGDEPVRDTPHDLIRQIREAHDVPRLYVCCGTQDALYPDNLAFVEACGQHGVAVATDFGPGEHNWAYWDARIQEVLAWFQVVRR